jgi:hypothetical protein
VDGLERDKEEIEGVIIMRKLIVFVLCIVFLLSSSVYARNLPVNPDAPTGLIVRTKYNEHGNLYFELTCSTPKSIAPFLNRENYTVTYEVDYKEDGGQWQSESSAPMLPLGREGITGKLTRIVYYHGNEKTSLTFRVRFMCSYFTGIGRADFVYTPFSEAVSAGQGPGYGNASSWAEPELDKASVYGFITNRIKDDMSAPITREEFAEVSVKLYEKYTGKQAATGDMSVFADTSNPEIFKAYNLKIVNGTDAARKLFSPKGLVNRQQVAAMLFRTISAINPEADLGTSGAGTFADEKDIAPWAIDAVRFMNKNGFLKGSDNKIDPGGICTREMAVIIAARVYEKYADYGAASEEVVSSRPAVQAEDKGAELPANFPGDVPIIPDAVINTAEGFEADHSGMLIYDTNYSVDEAIEFYSNKSLYKGLNIIMPMQSDGSKSIQIDTIEYILLVSASDALQGAAGKTTITVTVFETGLSL